MTELEIKPTPAMKTRVTSVMVSAFILIGVIVWLLTGGGVGLFASKVDLTTYMPDATGLAMGAPVRVSGIQVGTVKYIQISRYLDHQRAVQVDLRLEKNFLSAIPADSLTSIGSDTLIGNKFVDIAAGKSKQPVEAGSLLASEPADTAADKADLIYSIRNSMNKVDTILKDVGNPNSPSGHYIMGDKEYGQIIRSVDGFESQMRSLASAENPAGAMFFKTDLYASADKSLTQIDATLQSIQKGEGVAGHLYASDEQYNSILTQIRDLRKSIGQMRTDMKDLAPGLRDEAAYQKMTRMLASTDAMLAGLNRGQGRAGDLLTDPQMYESLVGSLKNLQDFVHDFRGNPKKYLRVQVFGKKEEVAGISSR